MRSNCFFYAIRKWIGGAKYLWIRRSRHWWGGFHMGVSEGVTDCHNYHPIETHGGNIKDTLFDGHVLDFDTAEPFAKCNNKDCKCHLK